MRAHLAQNRPQFEADKAFARGLGELFGVESHREGSVESYVSCLGTELKLDPPARTMPCRGPSFTAIRGSTSTEGDCFP